MRRRSCSGPGSSRRTNSTSGVRTATSRKRRCACLISSSVRIGSFPESGAAKSNLQNHRHDQWTTGGVFDNVALEVLTDFFLDHAVVGLFFITRNLESLQNDLARFLHESVFSGSEAAHYDFRGGFD